MKLSYTFLILLVILVLFFIACIYQLNVLPEEWYGDISNVHEYVNQILSGERPFYFFQSPGPLYHYLITPIVFFYRNHGYDTYK